MDGWFDWFRHLRPTPTAGSTTYCRPQRNRRHWKSASYIVQPREPSRVSQASSWPCRGAKKDKWRTWCCREAASKNIFEARRITANHLYKCEGDGSACYQDNQNSEIEKHHAQLAEEKYRTGCHCDWTKDKKEIEMVFNAFIMLHCVNRQVDPEKDRGDFCTSLRQLAHLLSEVRLHVWVVNGQKYCIHVTVLPPCRKPGANIRHWRTLLVIHNFLINTIQLFY